jgi:hypothetical protein
MDCIVISVHDMILQSSTALFCKFLTHQQAENMLMYDPAVCKLLLNMIVLLSNALDDLLHCHYPLSHQQVGSKQQWEAAGHRLLPIQVVSVGVTMSNVWGGCYHCYLVGAAPAAAAFLVAPSSAASALNLELQAVPAEVAVGRDDVVGYYQLLSNRNFIKVLCNKSS